MSYDRRIDDHIRVLQKSIGTKSDGAWGVNSQKALVDSGKKLSYDWSKLRRFAGGFSQSQVDGMNAILDALNNHGGDAINPLYASYMLATAWHETAHTMKPIREYGRGRGRRYGTNIDIDGSRYTGLNHIYYGRGYVQLTWLTNYARMKSLIGVDFVNNPDLALRADYAAMIMLTGMLNGLFTGLSLSRCIRYGSFAEFVYARRIINGTDRDRLIAGHAVNFLECLEVK